MWIPASVLGCAPPGGPCADVPPRAVSDADARPLGFSAAEALAAVASRSYAISPNPLLPGLEEVGPLSLGVGRGDGDVFVDCRSEDGIGEDILRVPTRLELAGSVGGLSVVGEQRVEVRRDDAASVGGLPMAVEIDWRVGEDVALMLAGDWPPLLVAAAGTPVGPPCDGFSDSPLLLGALDGSIEVPWLYVVSGERIAGECALSPVAALVLPADGE